jgi:hypothetical protein
MMSSDLDQSLSKLFQALPPALAMAHLTPFKPRAELQSLVIACVVPRPVAAGLWLYVDDLQRSHTVSQTLTSATGSYWHAIMHRREGDFPNAKYWYSHVGHHPIIEELGYDPLAFTDDCQADQGQNSPTLVEMQRREWRALFDWCRLEAGGLE